MRRRQIIGVVAALSVVVATGAALFLRRRVRAVPDDGKPHVSGVWAREQAPGRSSLHAVWSSAGSVGPIAVGDDGVILMRGDHATWNAAPSPTKATLRCVASDYDAFAVGDDGTILHYDRSRREWAAEASGTHENLYGVAAPAKGPSAFVVGAHGVVLQRETNELGEGSWLRVPVTTTADLFAVRVFDERVFITGANGTVLSSAPLRGRAGVTVFSAQATPSTAALRAISRTETTAVAIAGARGTMLISTGDRPWAVEPLPTTRDVRALDYVFLPEAVALPSGGRFPALAAALVVATDDAVYAQITDIGDLLPHFEDLENRRAPKGITGLAGADRSLFAVTETGEIWRFSEPPAVPSP